MKRIKAIFLCLRCPVISADVGTAHAETAHGDDTAIATPGRLLHEDTGEAAARDPASSLHKRNDVSVPHATGRSPALRSLSTWPEPGAASFSVFDNPLADLPTESSTGGSAPSSETSLGSRPPRQERIRQQRSAPPAPLAALGARQTAKYQLCQPAGMRKAATALRRRSWQRAASPLPRAALTPLRAAAAGASRRARAPAERPSQRRLALIKAASRHGPMPRELPPSPRKAGGRGGHCPDGGRGQRAACQAPAAPAGSEMRGPAGKASTNQRSGQGGSQPQPQPQPQTQHQPQPQPQSQPQPQPQPQPQEQKQKQVEQRTPAQAQVTAGRHGKHGAPRLTEPGTPQRTPVPVPVPLGVRLYHASRRWEEEQRRMEQAREEQQREQARQRREHLQRRLAEREREQAGRLSGQGGQQQQQQRSSVPRGAPGSLAECYSWLPPASPFAAAACQATAALFGAGPAVPLLRRSNPQAERPGEGGAGRTGALRERLPAAAAPAGAARDPAVRVGNVTAAAGASPAPPPAQAFSHGADGTSPASRTPEKQQRCACASPVAPLTPPTPPQAAGAPPRGSRCACAACGDGGARCAGGCTGCEGAAGISSRACSIGNLCMTRKVIRRLGLADMAGSPVPAPACGSPLGSVGGAEAPAGPGRGAPSPFASAYGEAAAARTAGAVGLPPVAAPAAAAPYDAVAAVRVVGAAGRGPGSWAHKGVAEAAAAGRPQPCGGPGPADWRRPGAGSAGLQWRPLRETHRHICLGAGPGSPQQPAAAVDSWEVSSSGGSGCEGWGAAALAGGAAGPQAGEWREPWVWTPLRQRTPVRAR